MTRREYGMWLARRATRAAWDAMDDARDARKVAVAARRFARTGDTYYLEIALLRAIGAGGRRAVGFIDSFISQR